MATGATSVMNKPLKKTSAQPSTPSSQRTLDLMMPEKTLMPSNQQSVTMISLQDMMIKMQQSIDKNHEIMEGKLGIMNADIKGIDNRVGRLDDKMEKLDEKIGTIQGALANNEERIRKVEEYNERVETRLQFAESRTEYINRNLEEAILTLELEKSAFFLRFQNVIEERDEDLSATMVEILAEITGKSPQETLAQIDEIYRISTNYARKHKFPKEVHIRFIKRSIRDEIYNLSKEKTITHKGKEIIILRQVPRRVREKRRPYSFLSVKLNRHKIPFRWLMPEGLLVTLLDKKYRLTSVEDAKDFFDQFLKNIEGEVSRDELDRERESLEELSSEENLLEKRDKTKLTHTQYGQEGPTTRAQAGARRERLKDPPN